MLRESQQAHILTIVLLGDFNPVIIQPFWLVNKNLINETEGKNSAVQIIHNELVRFNLTGIEIEVSKDRFVLKSTQPPYFDIMKDLVVNIFTILSETPLRSLGINHIKHFSIHNSKVYLELGDKLAPLSNWSNFMKEPRLLHIEMIEKDRKDSLPGYYRIHIAPSDLIPSSDYGIQIGVNDHFEVQDKSLNKDASHITTLLGMSWKDSSIRFDEIIDEMNRVLF
jgi:hypothetical protein